jgi:hypothetical protein
MWANSVWGLFGLSASCVMTMLGLSQDSPWQSTLLLGAILFFVGSLGVLCWPLHQSANRARVAALVVHPTRAVRLIEPSHIIILGITIAVIGVVWQMRRTPSIDPRVAELQSEIIDLNQKLSDSLRPKTGTAKLAQINADPIPVVPQKIKTNPYDVPKKLALIDEQLIPMMRVEIDAHVNRGMQLSRSWGQQLQASKRTEYMADLRSYLDASNALAQKIAKYQKDFEHWDDIRLLLDQTYQRPFFDGLTQFMGAIGAIGDPPYNMDLDYFFKDRSETFKAGIVGLARWRHDADANLISLRRELASQ